MPGEGCEEWAVEDIFPMLRNLNFIFRKSLETITGF